MKVLMLGWEFPPYYSGGLGVATKNIAEALVQHGSDITFAIPFFIFQNVKDSLHDLPFTVTGHQPKSKIRMAQFTTTLSSPYISAEKYAQEYESWCTDAGVSSGFAMYGKNLFAEIERYAQEMESFVQENHFDILHAHDWITFHAALRIKEHLNIPFVAHVHATEIDRTGANPNPEIYQREQTSLQAADHIIAVSNHTKQMLIKWYELPSEKIEVVHNGIEDNTQTVPNVLHTDQKTILFLGRLTIQKGPDWFLKIAKKVLEQRQDVQFILGGMGDMLPHLLSEIYQNNLSDHVFCLGFLNGHDREYAFAAADAYVMPSVSEPFGLSAVEAAQRGVPVILSHQSGVKEVISHSLCADFWDVKKMAHHILAVLEYSPLQNMLSQKAAQEISAVTWHEQVKKILQLYTHLSPLS